MADKTSGSQTTVSEDNDTNTSQRCQNGDLLQEGTGNPTPQPTAQQHTHTDTALDYEQIVNKLHRLANEDHPQPNSETSADDPSLSLDSIKSPPPQQMNGISGLKTPTNTPENSLIPGRLADSSCGDTLVVSRDAFGISYIRYQSEVEMPDIMSLISKDLSEPYSIYTYRYFIHNWPHLCFLAANEDDKTVGAIVCKIDPHKRTMRSRGYIAMLAVDHDHRRKKIGSNLVSIAIEAMIQSGADEIVLETEVTNISALNLYEKLGFVRDKRLYKYYLNGVDAFRLKLWLT